MANMIVSGAGTSAANGTYEEFDVKNSKPAYRMVSVEGAEGYLYLVYAATRWCVSLATFATGIHHTQSYYYAQENVATPDLVTTWVVGARGTAPVPTVTAEGDEPEPPAKKYRYKPVSQLTGSIRQLGM